MILILFTKLLLYLCLLFDSFILIAIGPFTHIGIDLPVAVASIFYNMWKVTMYLFAIAPVTFSMIYSWLYFYFMVWVMYHSISIVKSFIPRSTVQHK